jgi:hypothetical protein
METSDIEARASRSSQRVLDDAPKRSSSPTPAALSSATALGNVTASITTTSEVLNKLIPSLASYTTTTSAGPATLDNTSTTSSITGIDATTNISAVTIAHVPNNIDLPDGSWTYGYFMHVFECLYGMYLRQWLTPLINNHVYAL